VYYYTANSLVIVSEIELPELIPVETLPSEQADIVIKMTDLSSPLEDLDYQVEELQVSKDGTLQVEKEGIARFRIIQGRNIFIDPLGGSSLATIRAYLFRPIFAIILYLMRRLPIHASAVEIEGKILALCGPCGAGKSTLSSAFNKLGYSLLSDDFSVVIPRENHMPLLFPSYPMVKLWQNSIDHLAVLSKSIAPDPGCPGKYHLEVPGEFQVNPRPLSHVYFLEPNKSYQEPVIENLSVKESLVLLSRHSYRGKLIPMLGCCNDMFQQCARIAQTITLCRFRRPWDLERLDESITALLSHFTEQCLS
jgi:hypothetical protein